MISSIDYSYSYVKYINSTPSATPSPVYMRALCSGTCLSRAAAYRTAHATYHAPNATNELHILTARAPPVQQESKSDNMSCVHLYLGQAGNQIGKEFWGLAEDEFYVDGGGGEGSVGRPRGARRSARRPPSNTASVNTMHRPLHPGGAAMFHEDGSARCLAVDSEPKARTR